MSHNIIKNNDYLFFLFFLEVLPAVGYSELSGKGCRARLNRT